MRRRLSALALRAASAGLLVGFALAPTACHRQLAKLSAAGEHEEVVRRAHTARRLPKNAAARAFARSLVALDRVEEARAVLQRDFRHGGHVASLVALADLELAQGLDGMAAAHYARIFSLETGPLHAREDVCGLFRARARAFLAQGEAVAAHVDMRRAKVLCGEPDLQSERLRDGALWLEIEAAAEAQVRAQRALPASAPSVAAPSVSAAGAGPALVDVETALARGIELGPPALAAALEAELAGALGPSMLSDDELRALVGDASWDALVPALDGLDPSARAYAKLRLSAVLGSGLEVEQGERERQRWATDVMGGAGGSAPPGAWRALVVVGDLGGAELALTTALRARVPTPAAEPAAEPGGPAKSRKRAAPAPDPAPADPVTDPDPAPAAAQDRVPRPEAWFGRVPVTAQTLPDLLALARLFAARGEDARGLALARWALAEARAGGLDGVEASARTLAYAWLESGRPWSALALADAVGGSVQVDTRAAAATFLELALATCGDRCEEDLARRETETVMGEAWSIAELAFLLEVPGEPPPAGACLTLGELLAPDAEGPLAGALEATRDGTESATLAAAYARAIESDLTLTCAAEHLIPLMAARGFTVTASKLSERLAHTPELEAAGQFETHARLSLLAGEVSRARMMTNAAAGISPDPRAVWRRAAEDGMRYGPPDYAAEGWRQLLLLDPQAADEEARRRLAYGQVRVLATSFHGRNTPSVQDSLTHTLGEWLERDPGRRWSRLEALARSLAADAWPKTGADAEAARAAVARIWADDAERARHPVGAGRLARALGDAFEAPAPTPLGFDLAALAIEGGGAPALPPGAAVARPGTASHLRLRVARGTGAGPERTRALLGVALTGSPRDRAQALLTLLHELAPADARAVRDALATRPLAAGPDLRPTPVLADDQARRAVLLGVESGPEQPAR